MATLLGIFDNRADVESAINELENNGFNTKDISIVMQDSEAAQDLGTTTGANVAAGATTGATTGAVIGGLAGLLVGIGAIAVPGIGALLIGGPLAAALGLTGAAATTASGALTGAVAGGLLGALMGLGVPEEQARVYENRVREGAILLAVSADSRSEGVAMDILRDHYADQISTIDSDETDRQDEMVVRRNTPAAREVRDTGRSRIRATR